MLNEMGYVTDSFPLGHCLDMEKMGHRGNGLSGNGDRRVRDTNSGDGMASSPCYHMSLVNLPIKFRHAVQDE